MSADTPAPVVNCLLDGLPRKDRQRMLERCETVDLVFGGTLYEQDQPVQYVYFPLCGFISLVAIVGGGQNLEMGLLGNEGMLGVTLVLGVKDAPLRAVVQGAGTALRMSAGQFRRQLKDSPALLGRLNRYLYVFMAQLSQTAGCNRFHQVEPRLARWLLMTHDRAHADEFLLTHKFLAEMIGVQRSAVTIAAGVLKKRKLIRYSRGKITILSRNGLEEASCKCYEAEVEDYARQFGRT
jgi:CRP-like cAMP-binding protein